MEGSGTPVLIIHGGPGLTSSSVQGISDLLRSRYSVIRYDQPGTCGACHKDQDLTVLRFIEQIEALRRTIGTERLILLGHSWGAALACLYAEAYSDRVAALVLVHPMEIASRFCALAAEKSKRGRSKQHRRRKRQTAMKNLNLTNFDRRVARAIWKDLERSWPAPDGRGYDLTKVVEKIISPTQIILGDYDVIDARSGALFAQLMRAQVAHFHQSGHWSFLEEPQKFQRTVSNFLSICSERPAVVRQASAAAKR